MALLNGQSPEEISKEIITKAVESILVDIDGVRGQDLDELIRYKFSKKVYAKGERWFQKNLDNLRSEYLESVIEAQIKQRRKLDEKQQDNDNLEYFKLLVSRGMAHAEAMVEAGLAPKPTEEVAEVAAIPTEEIVIPPVVAESTEPVKETVEKKAKK